MKNSAMQAAPLFNYSVHLYQAIMSQEDNLKERLVALKSEHRDMDDAIQALSQRTVPDMIQIQRLKKRKLFLRDEINKIESQMLPDIIA